MNLRLATMDDAGLLLAWRNDPRTRFMMHTTEEISLVDHLAWLEKTLANPTRKLYIAEIDGTPVGTVRADITDGITEFSWTVDPQHRGYGVGKEMVSKVASTISGPLRVEVKVENIASQKIALHAGMRFDRRVGNVLHFIRQD